MVLRLTTLVCALFIATLGISQDRHDDKVSKRARLPKFENLPPGIFYKDAFQEGLEGHRPLDLRATSSRQSRPTNPSGPISPKPTVQYRWSNVIGSDVIEDEIKLIHRRVVQSVTTPGRFQQQGFREVRVHFSMAAALFAIISDFDGQVRWKTDAPTARERFARSAANAKVGTTEVYNEAKVRAAELEELIRGGRLSGHNDRSRTNWANVCERGPLMKRLQFAHQDQLSPWTASKSQFSTNRERIAHEARIVAAISEMLRRPGMEDGDDDDYRSYCESLKSAANGIVHAVENNDHVQARRQNGELKKSCAVCHDDYRA